MRDDFGREWTKQEYIYAIIGTIGILIAILIPVSILLGFDAITNWKYWYAWTIIFLGIVILNIWITFRKR